mmetsp:Transcript_51907/g.135437  ORF Transcript_51907/g.135437 Transcript_51907/m.135437 type:complete len:142 (-) Transcript_51907:3497-3922(-)
MPFSINFSACFNKLAVIIIIPVVPSPISSSCDLDKLTNIFSTEFFTSIDDNIVAPSFVMIIFPFFSFIILSIPKGPNELLRIFEIFVINEIFFFMTQNPLLCPNKSFFFLENLFFTELSSIVKMLFVFYVNNQIIYTEMNK